MLGDQNITSKAKRRKRDGEPSSPTLEVSRLGDDEAKLSDIPGRKNIDDLLPVGVSPDGEIYI